MTKRLRNAARELSRLYAQVPFAGCKGLCQDNCSAIRMTPLELAIIDARHPSRNRESEGLGCPALTEDGRCSIYADRPLICRLFGATELLQCDHGCGPNLLSEARTGPIIHAIDRLSARFGFPRHRNSALSDTQADYSEAIGAIYKMNEDDKAAMRLSLETEQQREVFDSLVAMVERDRAERRRDKVSV